MSAGFTHLHLHTQYSLLDGAIRLGDLFNKCKEFGMDSVAITDHGAMYGALEFYTKAKKAGIKPIVGSELYVAPTSRHERKRIDGQSAFHLVLLAMDKTGYQNLMKLASIAQSEGFYYRPRIDMEVLALYNEGLIALTACLHGQVPHRLMNDDMEGARKEAKALHKIFGDRLYFELQENTIPEQQTVNNGLKQLSKEMGVKLVATNDCHYLTREEAHAHDVLLCIQTGKTVNDPNRFRFSSDDYYFKSADEMKRAFSHCPESIANTQEIVARCNLELTFKDYYFPKFPVPEGQNLDSMFTDACWNGLEDRFNDMRVAGTYSEEVDKAYRDRLTMEINIIKSMGFPAYFLIVADFIVWAKDHDIPVGPGRGSGAGSLAAFAMKITNIDPIPYGLIFERFLNPERVSMPDFDIDFCQDRRGEVIDYVRKRYGGADYVAQIITYGSMKARGVIRDVGRALDIPIPETDRIAKLVPDELKMTIDKALEQEPALSEAMRNDSRIAELINVSKTLEGLARHTSVHAAGVVVSPEEMTNYLPTCRGGSDEERVTQYDMKHTEMTGLIKFDFLGLKTLTVIDKAVKNVHALGVDFNIDTIPMDDPKTFELLCNGDALGVFQLESEGMRELLVKLAPEQFSDLIALVALYRPGPLDSGMVDDFVETKHGRREPHYPHPLLEDVLRETYGVIVYQEQVMKIASILASYSLGDADILRRAMGKKIPEVMEEERIKFMAGAEVNHIDKDKAGYIFDLMAKFAGYGFNKSHSAAYALVSYQTAYLKAHYPAQFMAALLTLDMSNTEKVVRYINECKEMGLEVLPPDLNESFKDFTVVGNGIRFGLAAVKNVGGSALDSIIEERTADGPYSTISDFCARVDSRKVNSRVIEALIKSGSFDSLGYKRSQFMEVLDKAMEQAKAVQRDKQSGQFSLFGVMPASATPAGGEINSLHMPDLPEWDDREKLAFEKATVGFYITGHPLDGVMPELATIVDAQIHDLHDKEEGTAVRIGGLVRTFKKHRSQKGDAMAFLTVEDVFEAIEVVVFPRTYEQCHEILEGSEPIVVLGKIQQSERGPKIIAETIDTVQAARDKYTDKVRLKLKAEKTERHHLERIKNHFLSHHGKCPVSITIQFPNKGEVDIEVMKEFSLAPSKALSDGVEKILGYKALSFTKKPAEIAQRKAKWSDRK